MMRTSALAVVMIAALGLAFLTGASVSTGAKPVDEKKPDTAKPHEEKQPEVVKPAIVGHKTAVFNMATIMRQFRYAKYQVWLLNERKIEMSKELVLLRRDYLQISKELENDPNHPQKEAKMARLVALKREVEDEDRKINKELNDAASLIISDLYDKMKVVVDKTAEENGFQLVFAYPDAVTPQEAEMPYVKELKLKPPAAQPFYVAHDVDITATVVKTLNEKFPPIDPETKKVVDTDDLSPGRATPFPTPKSVRPLAIPGRIPLATPEP